MAQCGISPSSSDSGGCFPPEPRADFDSTYVISRVEFRREDYSELPDARPDKPICTADFLRYCRIHMRCSARPLLHHPTRTVETVCTYSSSEGPKLQNQKMFTKKKTVKAEIPMHLCKCGNTAISSKIIAGVITWFCKVCLAKA
ncbi:hypothetical protein B566_EDAN015402 [Ephemera danica]|nr:hypothetical protein B566_EDAN015402 [Ephemera danica]